MWLCEHRVAVREQSAAAAGVGLLEKAYSPPSDALQLWLVARALGMWLPEQNVAVARARQMWQS